MSLIKKVERLERFWGKLNESERDVFIIIGVYILSLFTGIFFDFLFSWGLIGLFGWFTPFIIPLFGVLILAVSLLSAIIGGALYEFTTKVIKTWKESNEDS